eukprot:scpid92160/ scgid28215/ 
MCRKGVSASTIMGASKHKCQQSLTSYNRPSEAEKLRNAALLDSTSISTSLVPDQPAQPEPVHPELQGIDLDLLFQPPAPVASSDYGLDIDSLITSCSAEELKALETTQGTHLFNSCSYTKCTITNNITINVVKK